MENLYKVSELVKEILEEDEQARNSDNYLYLKVIGTVGMKNGVDINTMSIPTFMLNMKSLGFPCFETVRRTRQKLQQVHPELAGCEEVECMRTLNEEEYRNYARRKFL